MSVTASRVKLLVNQLTHQAPENGEKYNQTAVLPIASYYKLCALSDYLHVPRSRLSGMLLAAAISDAILELPDTGSISADGQEFKSPADYIGYLAWDAQNNDELAERHLARLQAKGAVTEVAADGDKQPE